MLVWKLIWRKTHVEIDLWSCLLSIIFNKLSYRCRRLKGSRKFVKITFDGKIVTSQNKGISLFRDMTPRHWLIGYRHFEATALLRNVRNRLTSYPKSYSFSETPQQKSHDSKITKQLRVN